MVREELRTSEEQGWTPEHIASYIVDGMQQGSRVMVPDGAFYRLISQKYGGYLQDLTEREADWTPYRTALAVYWEGDMDGFEERVAATGADSTDAFWAAMEDDIAGYVSQELGQIPAHDPELPGTREDATRNHIYAAEQPRCLEDESVHWEEETGFTPGYTKVPDVDRPRHRVWLTSVYSAYCPDHADEHVTMVSYLTREEAFDALGWLLAEGETFEAQRVVEKSLKWGDHKKAAGFLSVMIEEGYVSEAVALVESAVAEDRVPDMAAFTQDMFADDPAGADRFRHLLEYEGLDRDEWG